MDAHGIETVDLHTVDPRASVPAVRDSSSRSVSGAVTSAFVRETTELGSILDASALVLQTESSNEKQMGQAANCMEVAAVTSGLEGLDVAGDKYPSTQKAPNGRRGTRSMKPQAGNRSRFRPWGYI